jgi:2-polyprenyl-3-methyl-5-hydroxy-6-metoxy-1,4-benzoquinol methylase
MSMSIWPSAVSPETADIETSSEQYARRFSGAVGAWFLKTQESATLRMLAPYREATVLDVGGGHGQVTAALAAHGFRVTVFGSAESCRDRIERLIAAGACTFRSGNLLSLPYPDQSYDVVLSYRLLPHVARWQALLAELGRVARGAVLIDIPTRRSVNCLAPWLFAVKKRVEGNTRSFTLFDERRVLEVAAAGGFVVDDRYAQFFLPMALHRLLRAPRMSSLGEQAFRAVGVTERFGSPVILKLARRDP